MYQHENWSARSRELITMLISCNNLVSPWCAAEFRDIFPVLLPLLFTIIITCPIPHKPECACCVRHNNNLDCLSGHRLTPVRVTMSNYSRTRVQLMTVTTTMLASSDRRRRQHLHLGTLWLTHLSNAHTVFQPRLSNKPSLAGLLFSNRVTQYG